MLTLRQERLHSKKGMDLKLNTMKNRVEDINNELTKER